MQKCDNLFRTLQTTTGRRVICFTRVYDNDVLGICASDGIDLWKTNLENAAQFISQRLPKSSSPDAKSSADTIFSKFQSAFLKGKLTVAESGEKLCISLSGPELSPIDLELTEAKAADRKKELQTILFHITDKLEQTESSLKTAEKKIETLEQKVSVAAAAKNVFDMTSDVKRKKTRAKAPPKAPGMSVINPGSKKRTAAKGVQFD